MKGNNPELVEKVQLLITDYNHEDKILIGSANYFQNKRVHKHFPNCGHYLSRPDLYLFLLVGYFGLLKKYWNKNHILATNKSYFSYLFESVFLTLFID